MKELPHVINDVEYLRERRRTCMDEMLKSLDLFEQAELLFNQRTDVARKRHRIPDDKPLSVDALIDRKMDEQWQNAVNDCRYYRDRAKMYGTAYEAITQRLKDIEK